MKVDILSPSGCCHGVNNAINMAVEAKTKYNLPTFILGMLVHNEIVINNLSKLGIITIKDKTPLEAINEINDGVIIFTAHGHDESLDKLAKDKGLIVIDTTCAFVKTNHLLIKKSLENNEEVIFIGKKGHPETESTLLLSNKIHFYDIFNKMDYENVKNDYPTIYCQTTLSILELEDIKKDIFAHFKNAHFAKSVCNATCERQKALYNINTNSDIVFIVGSNTSSNTMKLYDISTTLYPNKRILQIKTVNDIVNCDLSKYHYATIVGGASTPIETLIELKNYLITL